MASSSSPLKKYDVFISYRGLDTRVGFTSHLHSALSRNYFRTYIDDRIKSGNNIWEELVNAIKNPLFYWWCFQRTTLIPRGVWMN